MEPEWELSESLTSDGEGVRALCILPTLSNDDKSEINSPTIRLLSATQAGSVVLYQLRDERIANDKGSRFLSCEVLYRHPHAVTALVTIDRLNMYATGCKDSVIRVFDSSSHELLHELLGHEKPVTSLSVAVAGDASFLLSGSWDGTAKVWNLSNFSLLSNLPDHENSVCVVPLDCGEKELRIATGSAGFAQNGAILGHAIRIWSVQTHTGQAVIQQKVTSDHDGPIRDLCTIREGGLVVSLASCSNDGTVRTRDAGTGRTQGTLSFLIPDQPNQQPPILLSVASILDSAIAAASEDGAVIVWNLAHQTSEPQLIFHPGTVWGVMGMPNGDLVTACQDGYVRIFTRSTERMAPQSLRQEFAELVQAKRQGSSGPSAEEIRKLPHWHSHMQVQGKSEGQVHLFQRDGVAIAAQWSAVSQTWIEVGQVMGGGGGAENVIDGVTYDHVFPIEVDSPSHPNGVASLRLGYNNGENPFVAAQRFIDAHLLPQYHLTQIADYITQRAGHAGVTIGETQASPANVAPIIPQAVTGIPIAAFLYLPMKSYKVFDLSEKQAASTMEKMKAKIEGFGKLSVEQTMTLSTLMNTLKQLNVYRNSEVADDELGLLLHMLSTFPPTEAFPALDLARMAVLHANAASGARSGYWQQVLEHALRLCRTAETVDLEGPAAVGIPMLSLRLFSNAFVGGAGSLEAVASNLDLILDGCKPYVKSSNKSIRLSVTTLIGNTCFYIYSRSQEGVKVFPPQILGLIGEILDSYRFYESEAILRTLVALGTLVLGVPEAKESARSIYLLAKVQPAASPHGEEARNAAREVYAIMQ